MNECRHSEIRCRRPTRVLGHACRTLALCLFSCSGYKEPYLSLKVDFDPGMVDAAKGLFTETAGTRGWLASATVEDGFGGEHDELSVYVFPHEEAVRQLRPLLSGRSVKRSISVQFYDYVDIPLTELDGFVREVEDGLERVTRSKVCRVLTRRGYCDQPRQPLLRYKARFVPAMATGTGDLIREVGRSWPRLRSQGFTELMEEIAGSSDAFEALLFYDSPSDRWKKALRIGNEADRRFAILDLYEVAGMSSEDIRVLADQARDALEARFGSPFCRVDLATNLCDAGPVRNPPTGRLREEGEP